MIVAPKAIQALQLANAAVLVVNSENLQVMREGLIELHKDFKRLLKECEDTSVRHAEELRELKERFSDVAKDVLGQMRANQLLQAQANLILAPFIIAKPAPLVEALQWASLVDAASPDAEQAAARLRAAIEARGGKIVWEVGNDSPHITPLNDRGAYDQ